jgi:hypothetical protein
MFVIYNRLFVVTLRSAGFATPFTNTVSKEERLLPTGNPEVWARDTGSPKPSEEVDVPPGDEETPWNSGESVKEKFISQFQLSVFLCNLGSEE